MLFHGSLTLRLKAIFTLDTVLNFYKQELKYKLLIFFLPSLSKFWIFPWVIAEHHELIVFIEDSLFLKLICCTDDW